MHYQYGGVEFISIFHYTMFSCFLVGGLMSGHRKPLDCVFSSSYLGYVIQETCVPIFRSFEAQIRCCLSTRLFVEDI